MNPKVAVIGTGRMGSALATALSARGFATTVWNRTTAKAEPLSRVGVRIAPGVLDAIVQADIIILNITNYESTRKLLGTPELESALRGKVLVQLTTGTPDDARQMQSWAQPLGIDYLDGAIISYPVDIGKPQSIVLYSGPEEIFHRIKPVLLAFGDGATFVGNEIGNASAQDMVILAFVMGTMFSLLQGYAVYEAENLPVEGFMPFIRSLMPAMEAALSGLITTIHAKDYDNTQATLDVWAACPRELKKWCSDHRVDHRLVDPQISLMDEAIKNGKGHADFAYLYELLRRVRTDPSGRVSAPQK